MALGSREAIVALERGRRGRHELCLCYAGIINKDVLQRYVDIANNC